MKAKIRKTGEIVDVIGSNHCSTIRSHQDYVSYIDSKGIEHDRESLNYYWDFEPIETATDEHWQDVRERAAIAALGGMLADTNMNEEIGFVAQIAVNYADALVKRLKSNLKLELELKEIKKEVENLIKTI